MRRILIAAACCTVALLLGGCINISSRITPENQTVKPMTEGSDCSYIIFGFGFGTNTVEQAMANASPPVQHIRSVTLDTFAFWFFGSQCITVVGRWFPVPRNPRPMTPQSSGHRVRLIALASYFC